MKLLTRKGRAGNGGHCVVLFGSGLIGTAIHRALWAAADWTEENRPYSWEHDGRKAELESVVRKVERERAGSGTHLFRCDIVWAAGVSGFGASTEQMQGEIGHVAELCRAADRLADGTALGFHLISSGGGLFEGMTQVGRGTQPAPIRPYGVGKLVQEGLLRSLEGRARLRIYRPASVYGFVRGGRQGLFSTLIANALLNRTSVISGLERTLRDYVYSEDIGRFVARQVLGGRGGTETYLLASGKPTSMFETIALIERLLNRPIYRRFEPKASNGRDLSFARSGLPEGWSATPLEKGLALLRAKMEPELVGRRGLRLAS